MKKPVCAVINLLMVLGVLGIAVPVLAEDCHDAAQTTMEMIECAQSDYDAADKAMMRVYRTERKPLDREGRQKLDASQQAWTAFRDAQCLYVADESRGGSLLPLLYVNCLVDLTWQRADQLKRPSLESGE